MADYDNPFPEIIGSNTRMQEVYKIMEKVVNTNSTILVRGETGTGKELIAKALHYHSKRRNAPFVAVNCSALTETLLESELFGHIKGSFTGAIAEKKGLFEAADKGTFFLDEVSEISPGLQAKLLRVLQEGTIKRVGSTNDIQVDVRVIAATNRNLEQEVDKGVFRRDLFYRLCVIEISIPPLRDKKDDIPILAEHFLRVYADKNGKKNIKGIAPDTIKYLLEYDWPGNVRELEHEIERAIILAEGPHILASDLSEKIRSGGVNLKLEEVKDKTLKGIVDTYEKRILTEILYELRWNKSKVANLLGISRQALNKKIDKYDLDRRKRQRELERERKKKNKIS
ncbi:MAG TPA: sigma-54-dependent Fis family transcriptional regulator [Candidatus Omnitrophica bacterium]|nr:sigma-54-dependent Fis family transcriptional regulator [Candidatus Omnitrophota bacterium]